VLGIPFVSCTVALYLGRLSGAEYVGFLQWTIPLGISAHHAANVAQKAFSKEAANAGEDPRGA
jgi:Na+/serine symporter